MGLVAYTVTAEFTGPEPVGRYVAWLAGGHVRAVCEGGALSADVVVTDAEPGELRAVQVRYLFPDRDALARYLAEHAPRLRAEGLALFGPGSGVSFKRSTGEVVHREASR